MKEHFFLKMHKIRGTTSHPWWLSIRPRLEMLPFVYLEGARVFFWPPCDVTRRELCCQPWRTAISCWKMSSNQGPTSFYHRVWWHFISAIQLLICYVWLQAALGRVLCSGALIRDCSQPRNVPQNSKFCQTLKDLSGVVQGEHRWKRKLQTLFAWKISL